MSNYNITEDKNRQLYCANEDRGQLLSTQRAREAGRSEITGEIEIRPFLCMKPIGFVQGVSQGMGQVAEGL